MAKTIELKGMYGNGKFTIVDDVDYDLLFEHSLYTDKRGYVYIKIKRNKFLLHRFILGIHGKVEPMIDHINRNRLDNRRSNLRECTNSQNQANTKSWRGKDSKGVYFFRGRWVARIMVNGNRKFIGRYDDKNDAIKAYNIEAKKNFGDFAFVGSVE